MKRIAVLLVVCFVAVSSFAQSRSKSSKAVTLKEGTVFVNANLTNLSFNSFKFEGQRATRFGLLASGGYALKNDLAVVGNVGFQSGSSEGTGFTLLTLAAGARYYVIPNLYATGGLSLGTLTIKGADDVVDPDDMDVSSKMSGNTFGLDLGVGYTYSINKYIAFEPSISYNIGLSNKIEGESFDMSGLTVNLGITIFLPEFKLGK